MKASHSRCMRTCCSWITKLIASVAAAAAAATAHVIKLPAASAEDRQQPHQTSFTTQDMAQSCDGGTALLTCHSNSLSAAGGAIVCTLQPLLRAQLQVTFNQNSTAKMSVSCSACIAMRPQPSLPVVQSVCTLQHLCSVAGAAAGHFQAEQQSRAKMSFSCSACIAMWPQPSLPVVLGAGLPGWVIIL